MPVWLVLLVYALAHARVTGLVVADEITRPLRDAVLRRLDDTRATHRLVAYLLSCAWCFGLWSAAPVAVVAVCHAGVSLWHVPAVALAMSFLTGATSDLGRR
jgi:Protein of unknown function (DUF1360)